MQVAGFVLDKHIFTLVKEGGVRITLATSQQGTLFGKTDQHEVYGRGCSLDSLDFGNYLLLLFRFQNLFNFGCKNTVLVENLAPCMYPDQIYLPAPLAVAAPRRGARQHTHCPPRPAAVFYSIFQNIPK
jgi:hypothetical protein